MIGDNPGSDIKGGNDMGWTTILVKTGVQKSNCKEIPATYVVEDFSAAILLILRLEKIIWNNINILNKINNIKTQ